MTYYVRIVGNDNKSISYRYKDLKGMVSDVDRLFALDANNEIKRVEIEPEWSGSKIAEPVPNKKIIKKNKK